MPRADPSASRAVLIGVSAYTDPAVERLPTAVPGARRLRSLLTDPALWGLAGKDCVVLSNPDTPNRVLRAVQVAAEAATDTLLIYFAGHGRIGPGGDLLLMLPGAALEGPYAVVPYSDLRQMLLNHRRADNQVLIVDCCHSGAVVTDHMGPLDLAQRTVIERTYVITACGKQQLSRAPRDEKYPAFTGALIDALERGVPGAPDPLPMRDVFVTVRNSLTGRNLPLPQDGSSGLGDEIALVRNRAAGAAPAAPVTSTAPVTSGGPVAPVVSVGPARPKRRRRRRALLGTGWRWSVVAAAVAAVVSADLPPAAHSDAAPGTGSAFGDLRQADPCALTAPAALRRFGDARQDSGYGGFDRCDVLVDPAGGGQQVDVVVDFDAGREEETGRATTEGRVTVVRKAEEGSACVRLLLPAHDDVTVAVLAKTDDRAPASLCAIADAATTTAVQVLNRGKVPARTTAFPRNSLFGSDACALLDGKALAAVPGLVAGGATPQFGNWQCDYASDSGPTRVGVAFDRGDPPDARDGTPTLIGGRHAFVLSEGNGDVMVTLPQRSYLGDQHQPVSESLVLTLAGAGTAHRAETRRLATALAATATSHLPPTRA
ncbi:caspase family protein [Streptomyces griseoviridis]|uniref:Caspase family protein n=1 Tax=Streptomyces griseoviridis TaxID=45398 RepID=A0A3Q9KMY4_STRGD|nr:caspase family protein [Streptomyces griseoviridis]AZS84618.1 caspase family protein [Streptomyces griseoviridis]QCN88526.1 hypothetical protein DDJ31_29085 [Streptomyces griseoviridis]